MQPLAVGVDFGTSNTVIAVVDREGRSAVLPVPSRSGVAAVLPSILCFRPNEQNAHERPVSSAGADAIADYLARTGPARLVQSMKSFLGSRTFTETRMFSQVYALDDLVGTLLRHLYEATASQAVVTALPLVAGRPIRFAGTNPDDALAQTRLSQAFEFAGKAPDRFGLEPEAAAYAFARKVSGRHLVLVADLGGGTSDFSVVEVAAGGVQPKIAPLAQTGIGIAGDRFDYQIVYNVVCPALGMGSEFRPEAKALPIPLWIYSNFSSWHQLSMMNNRQTLRLIGDILKTADDREAFEGLVHVIRNEEGFSLFQAVSSVKQALTSADVTQLRFKAGPVEIDRVVSRNDFERWIADDLAAVAATADEALTIANVKAADVTRVFLTGGSALVPAVRELFARRFGAEKLVGGDEFSSVAQGLALMAAGEGQGRSLLL
ncbi:MAG TPA: Hsp70 family protein [Povalibacter sp.]|uniref:Hsp70 family protein n=1 Tax=Povalibacter sp. TaxID=1962978 RepID=UPI002C20A7B3|nr:Hsp70 family protein [Povalibacter sp.]HMN46821.1 Hsp70 family protein [Povalibacter sp.]